MEGKIVESLEKFFFWHLKIQLEICFVDILKKLFLKLSTSYDSSWKRWFMKVLCFVKCLFWREKLQKTFKIFVWSKNWEGLEVFLKIE